EGSFQARSPPGGRMTRYQFKENGKPMKPSEILREAARLVEIWPGRFGCEAIGAIESAPMDGYLFQVPRRVMAYFEFCQPVDGERGLEGGWWPIKDSSARIIGLCLAAAI